MHIYRGPHCIYSRLICIKTYVHVGLHFCDVRLHKSDAGNPFWFPNIVCSALSEHAQCAYFSLAVLAHCRPWGLYLFLSVSNDTGYRVLPAAGWPFLLMYPCFEPRDRLRVIVLWRVLTVFTSSTCCGKLERHP